MKKIFRVLLTVFMLVMFIPIAAKAGNPYPVGGIDGSGAQWSNCTWSAWELVKSHLKIELPNWGGASKWYENAANSGYSVGRAPAGHSIKVTSGHVAYVTEVSPDKSQVYVKEGGYNYEDGTHFRYHEGWVSANPSDLKGYIYLDNTSDIIPVDMGESFIALIIRSDIWKPIIVNGGIVEGGNEQGKVNEYFRFLKQGDGSYIIKSLWSNCVLDVYNFQTTNGTYVNAGQQSSGENFAQRWYITGNGTYSLVPKCATKMSLTVDGVGKRTTIWDRNGWGSQIFSIYKVDDNIGITQMFAQYKPEIHVGQEEQLQISYAPSNAKFHGVKYKSSDSSVASVNASGVITGKKMGNVKIYCISTFNDNIKYEFSITVSNHNYKKEIIQNPSCLKKGILKYSCAGCNNNYTQEIQSTTHSWDKGVVTKAATATNDGIMTYTCKICKAPKKESIKAMGQKPVPPISKLKSGMIVRDKVSGGTYKVAKDGVSVEYTKPINANKENVRIPNTVKIKGVVCKVKAIAANAFKDNKNLSKITIGDKIITIGKNAFSGCKKLSKITGGKNIVTINSNAFYKCTALTSVTISSSMKLIGKQSFYGCKNLKEITIKSKRLTSKTIGNNAFKGTHRRPTVKAPKKNANIYDKLLKSKGKSSKTKIQKF